MEEQGKPGDCVEREDVQEKDFRLSPSYIKVYQNQSQTVNNDMTTVNNIFRNLQSENGNKNGFLYRIWDFFTKLGIELVLNVVNPERFYKMAQGVLLLALAWMIKDFTPAEIVKLIQALAGASSK
jgi:hypothetical protein